MTQKKFVRMWVEENHNYYDLFYIIRNYGPNMACNIPAKDAIAYAKDFHAEFYLNEIELKDFAEKGYEFYVNNDGLNQLFTSLEKDVPLVNAAMRKLVSLDLKNLDSTQFFQEYLSYVKPYAEIMRLYVITQPHFIAKIEDELRGKLSVFQNSEELFLILTTSKTKFEFSEKGSIFQKSFAELLKSEDAELDMTILDQPLYEEKMLNETKKKHLIEENHLFDDVVRLGNILAGIGEVRIKMRFIWMPALYYLEMFIIDLKRRHGILKSTIRKYDADEFDELIRIGKFVDEKTLSERLTGFAKVLENGEIKTLVGQEANRFIESINKSSHEIKELKGMIASKGVARGRVIILSYTKSDEHAEKINGMKEGDILVSEMTRPNIIAACKKAGAIITDEGGITCHAAIVSRELKKPCIIGTKIATHVLKDGDLVEVDADSATVRILNR